MKNVKFVIPFAVVAVFATTSCGGNGIAGRLHREYYSKVDTFSEVVSNIWKCHENQTTKKGGFDVYNISKKGTFTGKANLSDNINVALRAIDTDGERRPLAYDVNDINVGFGNEVVSTWDLDKKVYGATSSHNDISRVELVDTGKKDDQEKPIMEWRKYLAQPVGTTKYYINLDNLTDGKTEGYKTLDETIGGIENYVMLDVMRNNGYYMPTTFIDESTGDTYGYMEGIGLDMSGFGGNLFEYLPYIPEAKAEAGLLDAGNKTEESTYFAGCVNYLAPGQLANSKQGIEIEGILVPLSTVVDTIFGYADEILGKDVLVGSYTKDDKNATAEFTVNFDLSNTQSILNSIKIGDKTLGDYVTVEASGTISLSYFMNFKDNFLYQQELALDFNKVNFKAIIEGVKVPKFSGYDIFIIDIKDSELHGFINGLYETDTFVESKVPVVNPDSYICLNPDKPVPAK